VLLKLNKEESEEIQNRAATVENIFKKVGHSTYTDKKSTNGDIINMRKKHYGYNTQIYSPDDNLNNLHCAEFDFNESTQSIPMNSNLPHDCKTPPQQSSAFKGECDEMLNLNENSVK